MMTYVMLIVFAGIYLLAQAEARRAARRDTANLRSWMYDRRIDPGKERDGG